MYSVLGVLAVNLSLTSVRSVSPFHRSTVPHSPSPFSMPRAEASSHGWFKGPSSGSMSPLMAVHHVRVRPLQRLQNSDSMTVNFTSPMRTPSAYGWISKKQKGVTAVARPLTPVLAVAQHSPRPQLVSTRSRRLAVECRVRRYRIEWNRKAVAESCTARMPSHVTLVASPGPCPLTGFGRQTRPGA